MTSKLAQAAMDARYILQVYCQFDKPVPAFMLQKVCGELVEALEEYRGNQQPNWDSRKPAPGAEWVNVPGETMYADLTEWSSQ